jgi:hypothetical protein
VGKGYIIKYVRGRQEKYETRSSVTVPDRIRIQSGQWIQIRIMFRNFMFLSAGCYFIAANVFQFLVIKTQDPDPDWYSA